MDKARRHMYLSESIFDSWNRLLQECELSRHYNLLDGRVSARNPVLDAILPSLLHVKAVAILDESLVEYLNIHGIEPPKREYPNTLFGRINFFSDQGRLVDAKGLHEVRGRRNDIAHQSEDTITWQALEDDVTSIEIELSHLGFVGARPNYEFYSSRSRAADSGDPDIAMVFHCRCGVKVDDQPVLEISWNRNVYRIGRNQESKRSETEK